MPQDSIDIRIYLQAIRHWWWLLILGPVLGAAVVMGISFGLSSVPAKSGSAGVSTTYEASAIVAMGLTGILGGESELASTRLVLEDAIDDLGQNITVEEVRLALTVTRINNSRLIKLTVKDADPDRAVAIADAVAHSLIDHIVDYQESAASPSKESLERQLADLGIDSADQAALVDAVVTLNATARRPAVIVPAELAEDPQLLGATPPTLGENLDRDLVLGIFLGGVLTVVSIILVEHFLSPVRSPEQFERKFSFARLGTLPNRRNRGRNSESLLVLSESAPAEIETIRQMATRAALAIDETGGRLFAVVSAGAGECSSKLAANLGIALSDGWKNVVLVDADLRSPSLHPYFNTENTVGLSDFLANSDLASDQITHETRHQRLSFISGGTVRDNPVELLSSPRMKEFLEQLDRTRDVVLLDTPPLRVVTDGLIVSRQVDGVILAVDGQNDRMDDIKVVVDSLQQAGTRVVGYVWCGMGPDRFVRRSAYRKYYQRISD